MGRLPTRLTDTIPDLPAGFAEYCHERKLRFLTLDDLIVALQKWKKETKP